MTPAELKTLRRSLGLSANGLASWGENVGERVAQSGRTVRRWEAGTAPVPGAVALLLAAARRFRGVRRVLGIENAAPAGEDAPE